jgi:hypothetical protein
VHLKSKAKGGKAIKRKKSLRELAKELGVSASYLSQIRHGKCPASEKVLSNPSFKMLSTPTPRGPHRKIAPHALILRWVDVQGAKTCRNTNDAKKGTISLLSGGYGPDKTGVCDSSPQWPT